MPHNSFSTYRTISMTDDAGTRGKTVTVIGRGFKNSTTATVWLEKGKMVDDVRVYDNTIDTGEPVLCHGDVGSDDTFTCNFDANVPPFVAGITNKVNAIDGRDQPARELADWKVTPQIVAVPKQAAVGETINVELLDFGDDPSFNKFDLGGISILNSDGDDTRVSSAGSTISDDNISITIPNGVALGKQALRIRLVVGTKETSYRTTMTIGGARLTLAPTTVVPNQSVTITGRGFTKDSTLDEFYIGGIPIDSDNVNAGLSDKAASLEVDSSGSWVGTVIIPVRPPSTSPGTYEFKGQDSALRPGVTEITLAPRTVAFDPPESRTGTMVTVTGAGWPASNANSIYNASVLVEYVLAGVNRGSGGFDQRDARL